jgi:protein O-GlcNAc transferase
MIMNEIEAKKQLEKAHKNFIESNFSLARKQWFEILEYYPNNISVLRGISLTYYNEKNLLGTEEILKKIIKINLSEPNALTMLILILEDQDKILEAKKFIKLGLEKNVLDNHWEIKMKTIMPVIKSSLEEVEYVRTKVNQNLDEILDDNKKYNFNIDEHLIKPLQFSLSYDQFDNLEINKKCVKLFKKIYPELNKINKIENRSSSKIKIGFISEYLTDHTIGKLFKGIILKLDQKNFDVVVFHTEKTKKGKILDDLKYGEKNNLIKNYFLPKNFAEKQKKILSEKLDILFYPEIGLSLELYYLSFIRLAKIQMTSWGHPETTSNSSIDYFLTSKLIEEKNSQKNFSEKLLYLDYLPMYYYTPLVDNKLNKELLSQNNIYSCPQTLQKIHPEFDLIISGILRNDTKAKINFIKDQNNALYKKLISRFQKNKEIDLDRINFIDGLSWEQYINHCGQSSVLLDPIYYGAGNSFYESVFYGTPTITMPTNYTKSRLVLGAYNQIDISDININPITSSIDNYVLKAVEISNKKNLFDLKQNIQAQAKKNLYENNLVISNFEEVIKKIVI